MVLNNYQRTLLTINFKNPYLIIKRGNSFIKGYVMKKILIVCLLFYYNIFPQWQQQLPSPYGKILLDIGLVDNNNVVVSGLGAFIKSTNAGEDWQIKRNINGYNDLWYSVFFVNSTTGWLSGNGKIMKTTDGGASWLVQNPNTSDQIYDLQFFNLQNGVAVTGQEKRVLHTTNGGAVWQVKNVPSTNFLECGFFVSDSLGFVSGQNQILKTTDSGNNWTTYNINSLFFDCFFVNENMGWFVGGGGQIVKTTDGGQNWNNQNSNTTSDLKSIFLLDENFGWAAGFNGTIVKTSDGGNNWNICATPTSENLLAIKFIDQNIGWAVGNNGVVLKSIDGGINWILWSKNFNTNLTNGFFINSQIGWLTSSSGLILKTSDAGKNWFSSTSPASSALYDVKFANLNLGWAAGNSGNIIVSTDGGINWNSQTSGTTNKLNSICFLGIDTGFAVGLNGTLLTTTNVGNEWSSNNQPTFNQLNKIIQDKNGHLWIAGFDNSNLTSILLKSTNDGTSWENKFRKDSVALYTLAERNGDFIIGGSKLTPVGSVIIIFKSIDGGENWVQILNKPGIPNVSRIVDLKINEDGSYVAITTKKAFYSSDGGNYWGEEAFLLENLTSVFLSDSSTFWITGDNSLLLKNSNSGLTNLEMYKSIQPKEYYLSQNYPNPFNPSTKIKYSVVNAGMVSLKIYDILGIEVSTLVNEEKPAGTYEINFNASSLASGVYFYRLEAGGFSQTKKLLLLK